MPYSARQPKQYPTKTQNIPIISIPYERYYQYLNLKMSVLLKPPTSILMAKSAAAALFLPMEAVKC